MRLLPRRAVVAVLALVGGYFAARFFALKLPVGEPAVVGVPASSGESSPELAHVDPDGDALVAGVLARLERWPNLAARYRQSVRVGEELQSGVGEYWQEGVGNTRRTCWQWQTLIDGRQAVFAQVYDKDGHLWTDVDFPDVAADLRRNVTRVNVGSLRRDLALAVNAAGQGGAGQSAEELELLASGGLSQLVAELRRSFSFGSPSLETLDGKSLIAVVGRWRPEALKRQWQSLSPDDPSGWPSHLPHHVVVKIGRDDFFPYAIEYRRASDAVAIASVTGVSDPLARFEFFDVRWGVHM